MENEAKDIVGKVIVNNNNSEPKIIAPTQYIRFDIRHYDDYESDGGNAIRRSKRVLQQKWVDIQTDEEKWIDVPEGSFTEGEE